MTGKDSRTYITLHDGMPENKKIRPLTDKAFRTIIELWCWCSRERNDGKIDARALKTFGTPRARSELISLGLIEELDDGYLVHDYLEHQRSRAQIEELSRIRSEVGKRGGRPAKPKQDETKLDSKSEAKITHRHRQIQIQEDFPNGKPLETSDEVRRDVMAICQLLQSCLIANGVNTPTITKAWQTSARLMLDVDGRDPEKTANLIRWAAADSFWRANILSMPTFRKQYDKLRLSAQREFEQKRAAVQPRLSNAAKSRDLAEKYRSEENAQPMLEVTP